MPLFIYFFYYDYMIIYNLTLIYDSLSYRSTSHANTF